MSSRKINWPCNRDTVKWKKFLSKHSSGPLFYFDLSEYTSILKPQLLSSIISRGLSAYQMFEGPLIWLQEFDDGTCNVLVLSEWDGD